MSNKKKTLFQHGTIGPPDLAGYGVTRFFGTVFPAQATIDYSMKIHDSVGVRDLYVFRDSNDAISVNSPLSVTTTPTSEVLGDLLSPGVDIRVISLYCMISGFEVPEFHSDGLTPENLIVINGVLQKSEKRTAIYMSDGKSGFRTTTVLSEFDGSFSTFYRVKTDEAGQAPTGQFGFVIHTNQDTWRGFRHQANTYSVGVGTNIYSGGINHTVEWSIPKNLGFFSTSTLNKNVELSLYYNAGFVDSTPVAGDLGLNNDDFMICAGYGVGGSQGLRGWFNCAAISTQVLSLSQNSQLYTMINGYFK